MNEQLLRIKTYAQTLDESIQNSDKLDLLVELTVDRVLLYLNDIVLDPRLERIVAQIVVSLNSDSGTTHDQTIASVEDNGQVVRYHQSAINYFSSKSDSELFTGFEKLLASYRRPHVITSEF